MSSELLNIPDDKNNSSISLVMRANSNAFLIISNDEKSNNYCLHPDEVGIKNANKIIQAITDWVEHVTQI